MSTNFQPQSPQISSLSMSLQFILFLNILELVLQPREVGGAE